jgi:2-polyprenyl-3-methyl-5-hydroxy-6-metoxy-1,4-benzoquinol methylase
MADPPAPPRAAATDVPARVRAFYAGLAFNRHGTPEAQAAEIRRRDSIDAYPLLRPLLRPGCRVLDAGCGTGWLANTLRLRYPVDVTGIDFNPWAIAFAQEVAGLLHVATTFEAADLFTYDAGTPFDLVVSIGALHHTDDCHGALRRLGVDVLAPGGHLFIGLYHRHGRAPFLAHFAALQAAGLDEQELLEHYRRLHPGAADETHLRSWFRDQVLHPHETQHTLAELMPVLHSAGLALVATSLNGFAPVADLPALLAAETQQREIGLERLRQGRYFPGFFLVLAQKFAGAQSSAA